MEKVTFKDLINSPTPVLVDFSAEWCGPCKALTPILSEVAKNVEGKAKIIKIDIDKNPAAANAYNVMAVPTMILFKNGQIVWRTSGLMGAREIERAITQHA